MLVLATTLFLVCGGQDGKSTLFLGPGVARKSRWTRRGAYAHCPPLCPEICSVLWPPSGLPWRFPRFPPARVHANATQSHETVETATKPPRNRDATPEGNHETEYFFNMKKSMSSFVKKMFGFAVFFGGFVAVSWRFRGGFDGFVALRGKTQAGGREAGRPGGRSWNAGGQRELRRSSRQEVVFFSSAGGSPKPEAGVGRPKVRGDFGGRVGRR